jgi:transposase-like protein
MTRRERSREERAQLVARWRASGETAREFGVRHGVRAKTLYGWAHELRKDSRTPAFVEVEVREPETAGGAVEIVLAGGRVVRVREVVDARVLRSVVEALESSC